MARAFSAARLRASASFVRLIGVSVATFDGMLKQLVAPGTRFSVARPNLVVPGTLAVWKITF